MPSALDVPLLLERLTALEHLFAQQQARIVKQDTRIAELEVQLAERDARIEELEEQLAKLLLQLLIATE
ncbi:MAG: hypothetical protein AB8F78_09950 [Saprospiraceae bacterium]